MIKFLNLSVPFERKFSHARFLIVGSMKSKSLVQKCECRNHLRSPCETQDIALKAPELDTAKRALAAFGRPFGLALRLADRKGTGRETDEFGH